MTEGRVGRKPDNGIVVGNPIDVDRPIGTCNPLTRKAQFCESGQIPVTCRSSVVPVNTQPFFFFSRRRRWRVLGKTGLNPTDSHFEIPSTSVAQTSPQFTRRRAGPSWLERTSFSQLARRERKRKKEEEEGRVNEKSSETNKATEKEIPRLERLNEERATRCVKRCTTVARDVPGDK